MLVSLMNPWYGDNTLNAIGSVVAAYILIVAIFDFVCVFTNLFNMRKAYTIFIYEISPGFSLLIFIIFKWIIAIPVVTLFCIFMWFGLKHDFKKISEYESSGVTGYNKWSVKQQSDIWDLKTDEQKQMYLESYNKTLHLKVNFKLLLFITYAVPIVFIIISPLFGLHYIFII